MKRKENKNQISNANHQTMTTTTTMTMNPTIASSLSRRRRRRRRRCSTSYYPSSCKLLVWLFLLQQQQRPQHHFVSARGGGQGSFSSADDRDFFIHTECHSKRGLKHQFQLSNCRVPLMDSYLSIHEASFLMAHDSATGYINPTKSKHWRYSKNQVGTAYDQLQNGARALDIRPKVYSNGTVLLQHGLVSINVELKTLVQDAKQWCLDNPNELVLLLTNDLQYIQVTTSDEEANNDDDDNDKNDDDDSSYVVNNNISPVSALSAVYSSLGINYLDCSAIYGLRIAEVMNLAILDLDRGGYLLALDQKDDGTANFCGKSNWIPDQLVTCYPAKGEPGGSSGSGNNICTQPRRGSEPLASLQRYILASANNASTDDTNVLGPPVTLQTWPFNEIQAFWQLNGHAVATGLLLHASSIIEDDTKSQLHKSLIQWIHSEQFHSISLFAIDNVALNGNALLSVLRTQCGQSPYGILDLCGSQLPLPSRIQTHYRKWDIIFCSILIIFGILWIRSIWKKHQKDIIPYIQKMWVTITRRTTRTKKDQTQGRISNYASTTTTTTQPPPPTTTTSAMTTTTRRDGIELAGVMIGGGAGGLLVDDAAAGVAARQHPLI